MNLRPPPCEGDVLTRLDYRPHTVKETSIPYLESQNKDYHAAKHGRRRLKGINAFFF